eukprot:6239286-Amphidinium_carterae.2
MLQDKFTRHIQFCESLGMRLKHLELKACTSIRLALITGVDRKASSMVRWLCKCAPSASTSYVHAQYEPRHSQVLVHTVCHHANDCNLPNWSWVLASLNT